MSYARPRQTTRGGWAQACLPVPGHLCNDLFGIGFGSVNIAVYILFYEVCVLLCFVYLYFVILVFISCGMFDLLSAFYVNSSMVFDVFFVFVVYNFIVLFYFVIGHLCGVNVFDDLCCWM